MTSYEGMVVLNYRLERQLGAGGFGTVYLAEHVELGRKAACKILRRELVGHGDAVERFFREARAACAIGHRAIVEIENFGRLPDGEPFYLMAYVAGESLARRIQRAPLQLAEGLAVFEPIAGALAAAHAAQIIHRDIKPDNIMVREEDGRIVDVKLLDFGIAKLVASAHALQALSQSSLVIGTPLFMSPEQARDASRVDASSDVYSFAATVYAAFAGRPPLVADNLVNLVLKLQVESPTPLAQLAPHVPARLADVVARCLAKEPSRRPRTITAAWTEMRDALVSAVGSGHPGVAVTLQEPVVRASHRRWFPLAVLALLAAGTVAVYLVFVANRPADDSPIAALPPAPAPTDAAIAGHVEDAHDAPEPVAIVPPEVDAGVPPAQSPRHHGPTETKKTNVVAEVRAPTPPADAPPASPPPASPCDADRFHKIAREDAPSEAEIQAALASLRQCKTSFDPERYQQLQRELLRKL